MTSATPTVRPYAVVTGASSGIGLELARQFAENGFDLLIAAENGGIATAAAELQQAGASVETVVADLGTREGVELLWSSATRPVDAIALNAGIGSGGAFVETDLELELQLVQLNVVGTMHLAKLALRQMVARGEGRVLFTSSIASTMPGPYEAVYGASKSFVQSLAEALRTEVADAGVTVTSLMPGPTGTNFFHRAGMDDTALGQSGKDDAATVARQGFEALMSGDEKVVSGGLKSKLMAAANAVTPDALKAKGHAVQAKPGSGKD